LQKPSNLLPVAKEDKRLQKLNLKANLQMPAPRRSHLHTAALPGTALVWPGTEEATLKTRGYCRWARAERGCPIWPWISMNNINPFMLAYLLQNHMHVLGLLCFCRYWISEVPHLVFFFTCRKKTSDWWYFHWIWGSW
jgi:hypothetical protein